MFIDSTPDLHADIHAAPLVSMYIVNCLNDMTVVGVSGVTDFDI